MKWIIIICSISFLLITGCSSTQETVKEEENIYVFDEIPEDTIEMELEDLPPAEISAPESKYYVVQIGAFTTRDKAEKFISDSRKKLKNEFSINYNGEANLFVVQIDILFESRKEAEALRNKLWKMKDYKDAWILTVTR
jgi:hypothetical protein